MSVEVEPLCHDIGDRLTDAPDDNAVFRRLSTFDAGDAHVAHADDIDVNVDRRPMISRSR